MTRDEEFACKLDRVRRWLSESNLDGAVLSRSDSFAWLGCAANSVVNNAQESGVGALVVQSDAIILLANNIETERLLAEELAGLDLLAETFPWHDAGKRTAIIKRLSRGKVFAADDGSAGLPPLPDDFVELRYSLTDAEVERYRALGRDAADALEDAARTAQRGMKEGDVAALISARCLAKGILPVVLLVAADDRILNWRHPVTKGARCERCVMTVLCGRRGGLVAALTRLVHFGELPADLRRRHDAVCAVDAAMIGATVPGTAAAQVLAEARKAYARSGFPDEWELHHQGGAIGYRPREYVATPDSTEVVRACQAFAWNPSIRGTKSEDTILVREEGFELLTAPGPDWPLVQTQAAGRADIRVR